MSTAVNPLAVYVVRAQEIVMQARRPGADQAVAIHRLAELLLKPEANDALLQAGAFDHLRAAA